MNNSNNKTEGKPAPGNIMKSSSPDLKANDRKAEEKAHEADEHDERFDEEFETPQEKSKEDNLTKDGDNKYF